MEKTKFMALFFSIQLTLEIESSANNHFAPDSSSMMYHIIVAVGVGCMRGKKGHILRFFWGPPRLMKNVILITNVKTFFKLVKN